MADQKFLVMRLGSLGDIVHTFPAVAALRESFANAENKKGDGSSPSPSLNSQQETRTDYLRTLCPSQRPHASSARPRPPPAGTARPP